MDNLINDEGISWDQPETPKDSLIDDTGISWEKPTPSTGQFIGNAVTRAIADPVAGVLKLAAPLTKVVTPFNDSGSEEVLQKAANWVNDTAESSFGMTPELQQNASFGQKVGGAIASAVPTIASMVNPVTAIGTMSTSAYNRATELIRKYNVSEEEAKRIFAGDLGTQLATYKVATTFPNVVGDTGKEVFKKYVYAGGATAAVNVGSSYLERVNAQETFKHTNPKLSESFAPTWEDAAINGIVGLVFGPSAKYLHDKGAKTSFEKLIEDKDNYKKALDFYEDSFLNAANLMMIGTTPESHGTPLGLGGLERQFTQKAPQDLRDLLLTPNPAAKIPLTDFLADLKNSSFGKDQSNIDLTLLLNAVENLDYATLGRSFVIIHDGNGATSLEVGTLDRPAFGIAVPKMTSRDTYRDVTHEVGHAVTKGIVSQLENALRVQRTTGQGPTDPRLVPLLDRYQKMQEKWVAARDVVGTRLIEDMAKNHPSLLQQAEAQRLIDTSTKQVIDWDAFHEFSKANNYKDVYAWTAFKEFLAVALENPTQRTHTAPNSQNLTGGISIVRDLKVKDQQSTGDVNWNPTSNALTKELYGMAGSLFGDLGNSSFLKHMYDGIFQLAQGQAQLQTKPADMLARAKAVDHHSRFLVAEIAKALETSNSVPEFTIKLENISSMPNWRKWALDNASAIFKNSPYIRIMGDSFREFDSSQLSSVKGRTEHFQTVDDLFASFPKDLSQQRDINPTLIRWVIGPQQKNMMNLPKVAGDILRFYHEQMGQNNDFKAKLYHSLAQHMDLFNNLPEASRLKVQDLARSFDGDMRAKVDMKRQGIWWPDDAMIARKGQFSPEEVAAYKEIGNMEARAYDVLKAYAIKMGLEVPERIPGHFPHVWKGPFKVFIKRDADPKAGVKEKLYMVKDFETRLFAEAFVKKLDAGHYPGFSLQKNDKGEGVRVATIKDYELGVIAAMMQDDRAYKQFVTFSPEMQEVAGRIDSDHAVGFQKHAENRSEIHGWLGEMPRKYDLIDKIMGKPYRDKRNYLAIYEQYAKAVSDSFANAVFAEDVHNRLFLKNQNILENKHSEYSEIIKNFPVLAKHLEEMFMNHTGMAENKLRSLDEAAMQLSSDKIGVSPYLYRQAIKQARNLLSLIFTRYNPGNWIFNYTQPQHTYSLLYFVNKQRKDNGLSTTDISSIFTDIVTGKKLTRDEHEALAYARDNHILDPQAEYQVRAKATTKSQKAVEAVSLGRVPTAIEAGGRELSYLIAYKYFKQVLGDSIAARRSATELMGETMVNYDRSNRPLMFQSFGSVGELLSPFAVYRNAWMGNLIMFGKMAFADKGNFDAWKPLLVSQATFLMTAGALGIVGWSEYDQIMRWLKGWAPEEFGDWPDSRVIMAKMKVPDAVKFGLLAEATKFFPGTPEGVTISGSGTAVGLDDMFDPNIVPFAQAVAKLSGVTLKAITGSTPTASEKYEALSGVLPGQGKFILDKLYQAPGVNTSFSAGKLTGGTDMNFADSVSQAVWGKPSLKTTNARDQIRHLKTIDDKQKVGLKRLVELVVDRLAGSNDLELSELYTRAFEEYGVDGATLDQMVYQKKIDREYPVFSKLLNQDPSFLKDKKLKGLSEMGGIKP